ncbi:MAG: MFS transporter, partial [Chloroflexota bacterium]|nr:MFS transporter [Chloroflexota bacterium]
AFYTVGLLMVHRIQTRATGNLGRGSNVVSSMKSAVGFVARHPYLRALFVVVAFHCAMTMSFEALFPAVSFNVLDAGREGVSYLMMGVGAGGLVSSIIIAGIRQDAWRGRMLLVTGLISGLSMLGLAASTSLTVAVVSAGFMGASQAAFMALLTSKVQLLAPDEMRGRISGLNQINLGGTMAVFNLVNGFLVDYLGVATLMTILGVGFAIIVVVSLLIAAMRQIYLRGVPTAARASAARAVPAA